MTVTITLKGALLTILAIFTIIFLIYLIALLRKAIGTLKKVDAVLDDTKVVSAVTADKAKKIDGMVDEIGYSVGTVAKAIKGNQSVVAAVTNVVNAVSSLAGIVRKQPADKDK